MQSPPESPADSSSLAQAPLPSSTQRRPMPPQVPRLQLSSITLEQLQAQASPKPPLHPGSNSQRTGAGAAPAAGEQAVHRAPAAGAAARPEQQQENQQQNAAAAEDSFAHVMVAADGTAALPPQGGALQAAEFCAAALAPPPETGPSPVCSVQQSCEIPSLPPLTARPSVSAAQQQLLATARQWQHSARSAAAAEDAAEEEEGGHIRAYYPPPLPSARASVRGSAPLVHANGSNAAATARVGGCGTQRRHAPVQRPTAGGGAPFPGTPSRKLLPQRRTYAHEPGFQEVKEAYEAGEARPMGEAARRSECIMTAT